MKKNGSYDSIFFYFFLLKMSSKAHTIKKGKIKRYVWNSYYSKNGKAKSKKKIYIYIYIYYENNKGRLQEQVANRYTNLLEEEKDMLPKMNG